MEILAVVGIAFRSSSLAITLQNRMLLHMDDIRLFNNLVLLKAYLIPFTKSFLTARVHLIL